jgi:DNA repair protein RadC
MTGSEAITDRSSAILQRISWAMDIPITQVLEMTVEHLFKTMDREKVCPACKDTAKCFDCPFNGISEGSILKQRYQLKEAARPVFNRRYGGMRCRVCLVRENNQPNPMAIKTADMAYKLVKEELGSADREMMLSILLAGNLRLVGVETVAIGNQNMVGAFTGELFKSAILANANAVILCHNHPSGELSPSSEDLRFTENAIKCGEILGIRIKDHLIVSSEGYISITERRFMKDEKLTLYPR